MCYHHCSDIIIPPQATDHGTATVQSQRTFFISKSIYSPARIQFYNRLRAASGAFFAIAVSARHRSLGVPADELDRLEEELLDEEVPKEEECDNPPGGDRGGGWGGGKRLEKMGGRGRAGAAGAAGTAGAA